jgi:hypothetical protein
MMKFELTHWTSKVMIFLAVIIATVCFTPVDILADEVYMAGVTNGCFGAGCTPGASATFQGLTYSNSTFSGTTANGFRGIGGNPVPGANVNNLGSVALSAAPFDYNGQTFTLQVTFLAPQGITGSNVVSLTAVVTGTVVSNNVGGVLFNFDNTPIPFAFNDMNCEPDPTGGIPGQQTTCGVGSFLFSVNDVSIDPGQTVSVTGQITAAQNLGPTAAPAGVSGRVMTASGVGVANVRIMMTDINGNSRTALTNSSGEYRFDDVEVGSTYVISASGKRLTFSQQTQVLNINGEATEVNFIAHSEKKLRVF